mgnify:CR=1 FL=1
MHWVEHKPKVENQEQHLMLRLFLDRAYQYFFARNRLIDWLIDWSVCLIISRQNNLFYERASLYSLSITYLVQASWAYLCCKWIRHIFRNRVDCQTKIRILGQIILNRRQICPFWWKTSKLYGNTYLGYKLLNYSATYCRESDIQSPPRRVVRTLKYAPGSSKCFVLMIFSLIVLYYKFQAVLKFSRLSAPHYNFVDGCLCKTRCFRNMYRMRH